MQKIQPTAIMELVSEEIGRITELQKISMDSFDSDSKHSLTELLDLLRDANRNLMLARRELNKNWN